jgi:RND family efflux transporter MFP subunit
LWVAPVLVAVVSVGSIGCQAGESAARGDVEAPTAVRVVAVEEESMRQTLDYVGTLGARRTYRVTARVPGSLEELTVEEGNRVERGERVARIEAPELEAKFERVEAEVRRAEAEREFACDTFETDRRLQERGALPASKLDRSRKRCASGREAVAAARAKEREVEERLAKRVERAPVGGLVVERRAEPGEHVGPGRPLVVIAGEEREVVVPVVEGDVERGVGEGTPVRLGFGAGEAIEARVDRLDTRAKGPGRAVEVHIPVDGVERGAIGRSVDVSFVVDEEAEATPVPREAVVQTAEGPAIFVVVDGVAHRRPVDPGIASGGQVAVEPKLEPGQRVVVTNLDVLRDDMKVYAVDATGGMQ